MVDSSDAKPPIPHHKVDEALRLDGDAERIRAYYRDWADAYDRDVGSFGYAAPRIVAELAREWATKLGFAPPQALSALDAGCGTGLVARALRDLGFGAVDGFDLSADMAARAEASGCYRQVIGDLDLFAAPARYAPRRYDLTLCAGVFTLGHVAPSGLEPLLTLTRAGGLLIVSVRVAYGEEFGFDAHVETLRQAGALEPLDRLRNAPYAEEPADYWVLQRR